MPLDLSRAGGLFWWATQFIRPTWSFMNSVGSMANQALFDLVLARLFSIGGDYASGVFGDDFLVTEEEGTVVVQAGVAMLHDPGVTDAHDLAYRPVVLADDEVLILGAPHATDVRIDVVSVGPEMVEDTPQQVWVRGSSGLSPQSIPTRRRFSASVQLTPGTPGGAAPETPAGHLKLAEVVVEPGGGVAVVDHRPILTLSSDVRPLAAENRIVQGMGLSMSEGVIRLAEGTVEIDGARHRFTPRIVTPSPEAVGIPRYDAVFGAPGGEIIVRTRADLSVPTPAEEQPGEVLIGAILMDSADDPIGAVSIHETGSIGHAQLRRLAVGTQHVQDGAITASKLDGSAMETRIALTHAGYNGATRRHTFELQLVDGDDNPIWRAVDLSAVVRGADWDEAEQRASDCIVRTDGEASAFAGGRISHEVSNRLLMRTSSSGSLTFYVDYVPSSGQTGTMYLDARPFGGVGGAWMTFPLSAAP